MKPDPYFLFFTFYFLLISTHLSAQREALILNASDSSVTDTVKLNDEIASCIKDIKKGDQNKIITLFLENIDNRFNSAVGIDLYVVNTNNPDSIQFLTAVTVPEANDPPEYKSIATYRIELNSYLNDAQYSSLFYNSFFILKMRLLNFSDTSLKGRLVVGNIKVACSH